MLDGLKEKHFKELCRLMEAHTGIQLPPSKRTMLEGRLRKRIRILGFTSLDDYGTHLFDKGHLDEEFAHLVDNVTTNKTDFFREPDHFEFLRLHAVPKLIASRGSDAKIKLWSAACSMGAEAYTMAMVLSEMQALGMPFTFAVLGTDICHAVLEQARRAVFPLQMMDMIPASERSRYVMRPSDLNREEFRIAAKLRRLVQFHHLNLMDQEYPFDKDIDVIFCRNILIYFAKTAQKDVLDRLASHLRPGGYLLLGHSESFAIGDKSSMVQIAPTVFQRLGSKESKGRAA